MNGLIIRPYQTSDLDSVIELFIRSIREIGARDYTVSQIDAWAQADRDAWEVKRLSRPTWVAVKNETVVGFADLEADGHVDMLYVHPEHQRMGVASALLTQIEVSALMLDLRRLFTEASMTALPFFKAQGFHIISPQTVRVRGQTLTNFKMEKLLK